MAQLISVGEIIDKSWHYYKKHFTELMSISGWLLVSAAITVIAFALYPTASAVLTGREFTSMEDFASIILLLNSFIITPIIVIWIFNALVKLVNGQVNGRSVTLKAVSKEGWKYFWPALLVIVLYMLIMFGTLLFLAPGFILMFIGSSASTAFITMIGSLLVLVGIVAATIFAVKWGIEFFFARFSLLCDDKRGKEAFKSSRKLVKGNFWGIVARLLIPKLLFFVIFFLGLFVLSSIADVIIQGAVGLNIDLQVRLQTIVASVLAIVQAILINPLVIIADYLVFDSLKKK